MRKWPPAGSLLLRYLISYFSIALLSCALVGMALFWRASGALNDVAQREQQEKLQLLVADLDKQQEILENVSYQLQSTIYYRPNYLEQSPYHEIELVADFTKYVGYSPICETYLMFYRDSSWIFVPNNKTLFDPFFARYDLPDASGLYQTLNTLQAKAVLREAEQPSLVFFAFPVFLGSTRKAGANACLCFLVETERLRERIGEVAGELMGRIRLSYGATVLLGEDFSEESAVLSATAGGFRAEMALPEGGFYRQMARFRLINAVLVAGFALLCMGLAAVTAYRHYRPIREIVRSFSPHRGPGNEIEQIKAMLGTFAEMDRTTHRRIDQQMQQWNEQQEQLRQQLLLMLLSGSEYAQSVHREALSKMLPGPQYGVLLVTGEAPIATPPFFEVIESLSDGRLRFEPVLLDDPRRFAVVLCVREEQDLSMAGDMLREVGDAQGIALTLRPGFLCEEWEELPASFLVALLPPEEQGTPPARVDRDWHKLDALPAFDAALLRADADAAAAAWERLAGQIKAEYPSALLQRYIFSELTGRLLSVAYARDVPVTNEQLGRLALIQSPQGLVAEGLPFIRALCDGISQAERAQEARRGQEIIAYIRQNAFDCRFNMDQVADAFGLSVRQIGRLVKSCTGGTFKELVIGYRMEEAKHLLAEDSLTVLTICERVGYSSLSNFIKAFTNATGSTPSQYRKRPHNTNGKH